MQTVASIITLLRTKQIDILTIQEPHKDLTTPSTETYRFFHNELHKQSFTATYSAHTITISNTKTLGSYISPITHTSLNERIHITTYSTAPKTTIAIVNIYSPHTKHKNYAMISKANIDFLEATIPKLCPSSYDLQMIAIGDLNIDIISHDNIKITFSNTSHRSMVSHPAFHTSSLNQYQHFKKATLVATSITFYYHIICSSKRQNL